MCQVIQVYFYLFECLHRDNHWPGDGRISVSIPLRKTVTILRHWMDLIDLGGSWMFIQSMMLVWVDASPECASSAPIWEITNYYLMVTWVNDSCWISKQKCTIQETKRKTNPTKGEKWNRKLTDESKIFLQKFRMRKEWK